MTATYTGPLVQLQRPTIATDRAKRTSTRTISLTIDGQAVSVREGTTLLAACREIGVEIPTLCFLDTLHPVNACRICVVELQGARVLVPACSRMAEEGMVVQTKSDRVKHSRKMVLEMLASSVDLSTTPKVAEWIDEYDAKPARFGPEAATVAQPVKVDNDLYVRDYAKCILCYKCVEACGPDHQNTFAIAVAGRGFNAHISTEFAVPLPDSACVYCGNCIAVCPTGALMAKAEWDKRQTGDWDDARVTTTDTICPYCGVGCTLTLHVDNGEIIKATSPLENSITQGNLCIKGRFGWRFVQNREGDGVSKPGHTGNGRR